MMRGIEALVGEKVESVAGCFEGSAEMVIRTSSGMAVRLWHSQDCCESVSISQVDGNPQDLVGTVITLAECVDSSDAPAPEHAESFTWTFYKFASHGGFVTVRWLGESNGYYSESVDVEVTEAPT